jgi:DNA-3-methyladenine glycosylase II
MTRIELHAQGPFSLAASADFLCGFTPATGASLRAQTGLRLGFLLEPSYRPVVVSLTQQGARVLAECAQQVDPAALATQLARMLSLDGDGRGLVDLAARDAVIAAAFRERPGFRPVCFASAYEAAVWGLISQRTPMRMAARMKRTLAEHTGSIVLENGEQFTLAPAPEQLLLLSHVQGLPALKLERLQALALAALEGRLASERLRRLERSAALAELSTLPGVGPWTAELIRMRGTGVMDELTSTEPRVFEAVGAAYGLGGAATARELHEIAEGWRPYRSWIAVLLVSRWMRGEAPARSTKSRPNRASAA